MMQPWQVYAVAFLAGFSMMGLEMLGSRILSPVYGSTIQVWGALIAVFMAGLSAGYLLGGVLADRRRRPGDLAALLLISAVLMVALRWYSLPVRDCLGRLALPVHWSALLAATVLFLPHCLCLGALSPGLVKLATADTGHVGRGAGRVFAISTFGSIVGTLITAFYLIAWMGTASATMVMALPLFAAALLCVLPLRRNSP
jgi:hypothetical protein